MKRSFIIGLLLIVFAIALGSLMAWINHPAAVVERSLARLKEASTADFTAKLQLENSASTIQLLGEEGSVDIELVGLWESKEGPDSVATDIAITTQTESLRVKIQGELRLIADELYLLITTTPQAFPALVQLKDQWLVMDRGTSEAGDVPTADSVRIFSAVNRQGVEIINGASAVRYTATASNEAVVNFMDSLAGILGTNLSADQVNQIKGGVGEIKSMPIDLWITRWSSDLKQIKTALTVPGGNKVQFTLGFNSIDEPVRIVVPEGAKSIQEILEPSNAAQSPPA